MRTKKKQPKNRYVNVNDAELLGKIIESAKDKWKIKDIAFYFLDTLDGEDRLELTDAILANEHMKDNMRYEIQREMISEGYSIFKVQTLDKQIKLDEFMENLFPYHNEQLTAVLF